MSEDNEIVVEETPPAEAQEAEQVEKETEEAANSENDADDTGDPEPKKDKGVGKRINELTREKYEAKREAEYWKQQAERVAFETSQQRSPQITESDKPTPDKFTSFEDYQDALVDYRLNQRLGEQQKAWQEKQAQENEVKARSSWKERENAARSKLVDYDAVVYPMLDIPAIAHNPSFASALVDSPIGAEVLYHLGKNPDEAMRIANLSPASCAREIGKIEARLESQAKQKSAAPSPPKPVHGSAKATDGLRDDLSTDEWLKRREAELRKR